jgi:hypothetical protein
MNLNILQEEIESNKLNIFQALVPIKNIETKISVPIRQSIRDDMSEYEKNTSKDYYFRAHLDISTLVSHCTLTHVKKVGYDKGDGVLSDTFDGTRQGKINWSDELSNNRRLNIILDGTVYVSSIDFSNLEHMECMAQVDLLGIPIGTTLSIFQELILEADNLEDENNLRVAFFTYFTALEAFVTFLFENVKSTLFTELHYSLEHLSLDDKFRVIFKHFSSGADLTKINIYSALMGLLGTVKKKRNDMAHGKLVVEIDKNDIIQIITIISVLYAYTTHKFDDFVSIIDYYYKK